MWNPFGKQEQPGPPPVVPGDQIVPLPEQDDTHINRSLVLNFMLRFNSVLDPEKLKFSLDTLLSQPGWRKIGARLRLNEKGKLEYHIPDRFDHSRPAFTASHCDFGTSITEHPLASQVPSGAPGDEPAVVVDPFHLRPLMRPDDGPKEIGDYLYADRPQLSLHIVSFTDATLVSLTWPHTLWDAMGRREFLLAWTAILAGRIDDVPPAYDPDENPLRDFYDNPAEPYKLLSKLLSLPQLAVFGLRYWFESFWYSKEKGRVVCLPAAFMESLRTTAMEEARAVAGNSAQDVFLSDGDLISAWCARVLAEHAHLSPDQTVCVMNALGWRSLLQPDVLSRSKAYIGNAASGAFAYVKAGDLVSRPLSYTASVVRGAIKEQATRGQLEAFAHLANDSYKATGAPPMFGDATMQLVVISNWSKGKFFHMDFSPAIVGVSRLTKENAPLGKPVYIQACAFNKGYSVRNAFQVSGKDAQGNYWLSATLRTEVWDAIERALGDNGTG